VLKISVPVASLAAVVAALNRAGESVHADWRGVFQATGIGCVRFGPPERGWPDAVRALRSAVAGEAGSVTVLRPSAPADGCDAWDSAGDAQSVMEAVKAQFDPNRVLNPGRFVGNL
jgi:glycolate oxidase FAD binding subunit